MPFTREFCGCGTKWLHAYDHKSSLHRAAGKQGNIGWGPAAGCRHRTGCNLQVISLSLSVALTHANCPTSGLLCLSCVYPVQAVFECEFTARTTYPTNTDVFGRNATDAVNERPVFDASNILEVDPSPINDLRGLQVQSKSQVLPSALQRLADIARLNYDCCATCQADCADTETRLSVFTKRVAGGTKC